MITINSEPYSSETPIAVDSPKMPPVPLSDCVQWCLQPDDADVIITPGVRATVTILIPITSTVPPDGTVLTIWGYDFEVDSSVDYTGQSFKASTLGITTAANFANMIRGNVFFNRATYFTSSVVGSNIQLVINWNECREQSRFTVDDMVFTAITALGGSGSYSNGSSAEYVDGYKMLTRLGYYAAANGALYPLSDMVAIDPAKSCDGIGEICVSYRDDMASMLYTMLPALTNDSFIEAIDNGTSMCRLFSLEYGWAYREACIAKSGTVKKSNVVLGINAAFDVDDAYQMRRYFYGHPDGYPGSQSTSDFLTTQPKEMPLYQNSFAWLWLINSWQIDYGASYKLRATFSLYKSGVDGVYESFNEIIMDPVSDSNSWAQPVSFNVSPGHVVNSAPSLTEAELSAYEVVVVGVDSGGDVIFNATEYLRFNMLPACEEDTDLYFLTPAAGIGTFICKIEEFTGNQDFTEINLQKSCDFTREETATQGGRSMSNIRNYESVKLSINCPSTNEWKRWVKHLRHASQKWLKVKDQDGEYMAKKLIIEQGGFTTYSSVSGINVQISGYLQDVPVQNQII